MMHGGQAEDLFGPALFIYLSRGSVRVRIDADRLNRMFKKGLHKELWQKSNLFEGLMSQLFQTFA
jgi:hypothetical protein